MAAQARCVLLKPSPSQNVRGDEGETLRSPQDVGIALAEPARRTRRAGLEEVVAAQLREGRGRA
eukprot:4075712-Alexandrium_andersonii.AAC.1